MQAQKWAIQYFSNQYSGGDGKLGSAVSSPGDGVVESGSASSTQTTGPARPTYLELQVAQKVPCLIYSQLATVHPVDVHTQPHIHGFYFSSRGQGLSAGI